MESRNIKITIAQAADWYNSNNKALKTLALNAYTKKELLLYSLRTQSKTISLDVPIDKVNKINILTQLSLIASFFNKSKEVENNIRYFIGKSKGINHSGVKTLFDNIYIYKHVSVNYAGIVYFNSEEDVRKAVSLLGKDKIEQLFNN